MSTITVLVQSLLNTARYDSYVVVTTDSIEALKIGIETATSVNVAWYDLYYGSTALTNTSANFASYGITSNVSLRSANKIGRLPTLEDRQRAKLALASLDRQASGYARFTLNIAELPTQYSGNTIVNNPNPDGLIEGRPWILDPDVLVNNLELEDGGDLLLEDGGFILLESST